MIRIVDVNHRVLTIRLMKRVHWENATLRVIASSTLLLVDHGPRRIVVNLVVAVGVMNMGTVNLHVLRRHLDLIQDWGNVTLLVIVQVILELEGHGIK